MTYNGWKNWETWEAYNWLSSCQGAWEFWCEVLREADDPAESLKQALEEEMVEVMGEGPSLWHGLLQTAFERIDFKELADAFLEE